MVGRRSAVVIDRRLEDLEFVYGRIQRQVLRARRWQFQSCIRGIGLILTIIAAQRASFGGFQHARNINIRPNYNSYSGVALRGRRSFEGPKIDAVWGDY